MMVNVTLLLPLILVATRPDAYGVLEQLKVAESSWPLTPLGQSISLSFVENPAYNDLSDIQMASRLARNYEHDLVLPPDADEGIPYTGGFLVLDDAHLENGFVKAVGFDDGWDAYAERPLDLSLAVHAASNERFTGEGWAQEVSTFRLIDIAPLNLYFSIRST